MATTVYQHSVGTALYYFDFPSGTRIYRSDIGTPIVDPESIADRAILDRASDTIVDRFGEVITERAQ